ncbi:MAG: hypothetical protein M3Z06_16435 [Actinomycetota bacterium]|nr:hypothetical protein [Actinomycetota bacterium]
MSKLRGYCGPFFVLAGTMHFVIPKAYKRIMPPYIPAHEAMVKASGAAEIAGGAGLMLAPTRQRAGHLLIATLIAVFPANLHMAMNPEQFSDIPGGEKALQARLPIQVVFIGWVLSAMRQRDDAPAPPL